jgi:hypothetical protein
MKEVTNEQIKAWKVKYGSVYRIPLETGEVCYVRSPKIKEIEACQSLLQQGKFITYNISLFKTCFLGGDEVDAYENKLMAASSMMMQTVETVTATLEKL